MRIRYLIDKNFQLKYAARMLAFLAGAFLIGGFIFYKMAFLPLVRELKNVYPEGRLVIILGNVYKNLIINFSILAFLVFVFAIFKSHKITGPIFNVSRHINQMARGDFSRRIKLRKRDEFKVLADEVNRLGQNIAFLIEEGRGLVYRMQLALDELHNKMNSAPEQTRPFVHTLSELEAELEQFREILKQYRI